MVSSVPPDRLYQPLPDVMQDLRSQPKPYPPLVRAPVRPGSIPPAPRSGWKKLLGRAGGASVLLVALLVLAELGWDWPARPAALQPQVAVRSIDTVKYSRDLAQQMLSRSSFQQRIDLQLGEVSRSGANYVAIDTPYDEEFLPILRRWVASARSHHLKVWFRGNFSGWEGWFDYPRIDSAAHIAKLSAFILSNPDLFQDGDIFTACPECENGGPGDPRSTGEVDGYRAFILSEYQLCQQDFARIHKQVAANYQSMNYDVAKLIMDRGTTAALGGVVTIDHYVADPADLVPAVDAIASSSGGKVVLGEFGAPIPDINGPMTSDEQATWITQALSALSSDTNIVGWNYWTGVGGSTALWDDAGRPKKAVAAIRKFYRLEGRMAVLQHVHVPFFDDL